MTLTSSNTCLDLYLAPPVVGEVLCLLGSWAKVNVLPYLWLRHESRVTLPFTALSLSHWLHPAHFYLIFLSHVPCLSGDESVQLLRCLMVVLKLGMSSKDQNKQEKKITHTHTKNESNLNTSSVNTIYALRWTCGSLSGSFIVVILKGEYSCLVQKATEQHRAVGSPAYSRG